LLIYINKDMELKINVKLVNYDVATSIPKYAKPGDAGLDIVATSKEVVDKGEFGYIEYGTNLAFEIPDGYYMDIRPRSSISNTGMILANSPCTLDSGYRGELKLRFKWIKDTKQYEVGERIAQVIILPYPKVEFVLVEDLSTTDRGEGGFGSSGK